MSNRKLTDAIISSKVGSLVMSILSILMGIFFVWYVRFNPESTDSIKGFTFLGIFAIVAGVFIAVFTVIRMVHDGKQKKNKKKGSVGAVRRADMTMKCRVLLEKQYEDMKICYRRVRGVNELVINGKVYDEYRAVIEFEHVLKGKYGDHTVEAGLDASSFSYIYVDGVCIAEKRRLV